MAEMESVDQLIRKLQKTIELAIGRDVSKVHLFLYLAFSWRISAVLQRCSDPIAVMSLWVVVSAT